MQIALVADSHITRGTEDDQALYNERFSRVIAAVNAAHVDVCLIAGDLTQGAKDEQVADFLTLVKACTVPTYWVPGNHDSGDKLTPGKTYSAVTSEKIRRYEDSFGAACQAIEVAGVRVLTTNASLFGSGLPEEDKQWCFLEQELGKESSLPTILLQHYPLFVQHPGEPGGSYWALEPESRHRLLSLLSRSGVSAVLTGHYHRPLASFYNGITFITAPAVAFGLPKETQSVGWVRVVITDASNTSIHPRQVSVSAQFIDIATRIN